MYKCVHKVTVWSLGSTCQVQSKIIKLLFFAATLVLWSGFQFDCQALLFVEVPAACNVMLPQRLQGVSQTEGCVLGRLRSFLDQSFVSFQAFECFSTLQSKMRWCSRCPWQCYNGFCPRIHSMKTSKKLKTNCNILPQKAIIQL